MECSKFVFDHIYGATETGDDPSGTPRWTSSTIKQLLTERLALEDEFNRPACKKRNLWQAISKILEQKTGSYFDSNSCDIKYRNLLTTYRNNKKRQMQFGESSISWEYFPLFDKVLGHRISSAILDNTHSDSSVSAKRPASPPVSPSPSAESISGEDVSLNGTSEKKKLKITVSEYLAIKLRRDVEHRKEQLEFRKEQLKLKENIWKEKKILKEKEIKAILELAKAMAEKNGGD